MKAKKEKRFVFAHNETPEKGALCGCTIIVDKETGVNYLFAQGGYAGGLTPLLDREGKPIITSVAALEEQK
ncbi:MAG: hypothetical protein IKM31_08960 [Oscillospiraceae bacterium]|nr:hypothetical protein [Oscillospiraceae bacterium]